MRAILTAAMLLLALCTCHARVQRTDTVSLFNGQLLIGEIKNAAAGILLINDADLKAIKVKQFKIRSIRSSRKFKIVAVDKSEHYGYLYASQIEGHVLIMHPDSTAVSISINSINTLAPLDLGFLKQLGGDIGAGFSYTKASNIGQLTINADISYITKSFEHDLNISGIASLDTSSFSRDNENVQWTSSYNINATWFAASMLLYQRNLELSILRRYQEMVGPGLKLFTRKTWQLYVITGLAFNQEKNTEGSTSGLLTEIPLILRFKLFHFRHPNIQISTSQNGYLSLSQQGRLRYSGNTAFKLELIDDFYVNINPYINADTQTPSGGSSFDFGTSFGISYEF